ncbi:MAG TPA: DUF4442 domain-containing protein [Chitinophagaceae bacterium]|nr:DUF4442 domain-containing protein [Chitinophagaceae bacterium]
MTSYQASFFNLANSRTRWGLYLFAKLPAAYFSGVKVQEISEDRCVTSVGYKFLTKNPFKSIYFASLAMAAEMSTGLLAMSNMYKRDFRVSLLVIKMEASYFKKATGTILFTCEQGREFASVIEHAIQSGAPATFVAASIGKNEMNEAVAGFYFTWSFKVKTGKL